MSFWKLSSTKTLLYQISNKKSKNVHLLLQPRPHKSTTCGKKTEIYIHLIIFSFLWFEISPAFFAVLSFKTIFQSFVATHTGTTNCKIAPRCPAKKHCFAIAKLPRFFPTVTTSVFNKTMYSIKSGNCAAVDGVSNETKRSVKEVNLFYLH